VVRVRRLLVVGLVARHAARWKPLEDAAPMARRAGLRGVASGERPPRVVERPGRPGRVRRPV